MRENTHLVISLYTRACIQTGVDVGANTYYFVGTPVCVWLMCVYTHEWVRVNVSVYVNVYLSRYRYYVYRYTFMYAHRE